MLVVGRIDLGRFRRHFPDVITDDVIITDEQILHIEERHPGTYQRFGKYIPCILGEYQYMLKDKQPNTALLFKRITQEDGALVQLVLRLHTISDDPAFKNSVLSMWEISELRWENYKRNKKILDKRV